MRFRDWSARRVVGLGLLWIVTLLGVAIARTVVRARSYEARPSGDVYYILSRPPGGAWAVVGPPILLVAIWLLLRRSRPTS